MVRVHAGRFLARKLCRSAELLIRVSPVKSWGEPPFNTVRGYQLIVVDYYLPPDNIILLVLAVSPLVFMCIVGALTYL